MLPRFDTGAYVRHARYGPARVTEILPDHIVLRDRHGDVFRVNIALADKELTAAPPDGFVALQYQRDVTSDYVQQNMEDTVVRLMRDNGRIFIAVKDLKNALTPVLTRDGLRWSSWWKTARKNLSSSRTLAPHPTKKGVYLLRADQSAKSLDAWRERIARADDSQALLLLARELQLMGNSDDKGTIRGFLLDKTIAEFVASEPQTHSFTECFLAICYLVDAPAKADRQKALDALEKIDLSTISLSREFDDDLQVALANTEKYFPQKAAEFARLCFAAGSHDVAVKAFSLLNSDRNRHLLKQYFFEWLQAASTQLTPNFELFLSRSFLKHVRKEDSIRLYEKLITLPAPTPAVKKILSDAGFAQLAVAAKGQDRILKTTILSAKAVTSEVKEQIIQATDDPEVLFGQLLADFSLNSEDALVRCLARIQLSNGLHQWPDLLSVLATGQAPNLARQLATTIREEIECGHGAASFRLVEYAGDLYHTAVNQYPDTVPILRTAVRKFVSVLLSDSTQNRNEFLRVALKEEVDDVTRALAAERDKDRSDLIALKSQLEKSEHDTSRLTQLVEMLKSSASQSKESVEIAASAETIRPFMLLLDDFERQASGNGEVSLQAVLTQLRAAVERAGLERIGTPGEHESFDPARHELLEEPQGPVSVVTIIRPGYRFHSQNTGSVIRRALVKPDRGTNR